MPTPSPLLSSLLGAIRFDDMSANDIRKTLSLSIVQTHCLIDEAIALGYVVLIGLCLADSQDYYTLSDGMLWEYLGVRPDYTLVGNSRADIRA